MPDAGRIITFYSYKGGTGRTMAVANVAWILATNGKRVLAVDWDLESPGLHRYFHPFLLDKKLRNSRGVIDLIRDYAMAAVEPHGDPEDTDWYRRYADVEREAVSLTWQFPGGGGIDLLPAGQQDRSYSRAVSTFEWSSFYDRLGGAAFIHALRDSMREHYDYVLVDSRTGLSDTASICTVHLPDTVVNCFTLNEQSIDGAAAVAAAIVTQRGGDAVRMLPVPMRVEDAEQIKLEVGRDYARLRFAEFVPAEPGAADRYWGDIEIPYKPFFAYEEILAAFGDRPHQENSLLAAFERLTRMVTDGEIEELVPLDEAVRRRWLTEFERAKPAATVEVLISYASIERTWADWVAAELSVMGLRPVLREVDFSSEPTDPAELDKLLSSVSRVITLLSREYVQAFNAAELWRLAAARDPGGGRFLMPVRLDSVRVGAPFGERHPAVDLTNLTEDEAREALTVAVGSPYPTSTVRRGDRRAPRYPASPPPVWRVPQRNPGFTGRAALLEGLRGRLSASTLAAPPEALFGLGGVGKTQVGLEYAHRFAADYDVIWWISASQPSLVRAALAALAEELELSTGSVGESVENVLDALRRGEPYRRWLLVFDNAGEPEQIREYLPQGTGHVLVTTRNLAWSRVAAVVEVGVFSRAESVAFLRQRVPALTAGEADQVAEKLGDLPLAIEQAGAWLAVTAMPSGRYLELLDTQLPQVLEENPPPGYERTAAATWLLSLEHLRDQMPAAAKLLELCAFFAPEPIPTSLLISERFVAALVPLDPTLNDPLMQGRLIREIGKYALARIDAGQGGTEQRGVQMHRLVQAVIRNHLTEEAREDNRRVVHEILAAANPKNPDDSRRWPDYGQLTPHLVPSGAIASPAAGVRQLVLDMVRYLYQSGDAASSQDVAEAALAAWRASEPAGSDLPRIRLELANALWSQGRYAEAYEIDQRAYRELNERFGPDYLYTIRGLTGQAADLRGLGRYAEARDLDEEALTRLRLVSGETDPMTLLAASNLAVSLRLVGDFRAAAHIDEDVLAMRRNILGPGHAHTVLSEINYGRDLRDLGRYAESRRLLEATLSAARRDLGENHHQALRAAKTLAVTMRKLGELRAAHALSLDTLARYNQVLGRNHRDTLACANNLACDLSANGDDVGARMTAEEALQRARDRLGHDHPHTLAWTNNLAIFLRNLGEHAAAKRLNDGALERFNRIYGPGHPYTLACVMNQANDLFNLGEYSAALRADREAHAALSVALGERHPDTLALANNLAASLRAAGDRAGSHRLRDEVLSRTLEHLGEHHPNTAAVRAGRRLNCDLDPPSL